jgi:hypothetical protein
LQKCIWQYQMVQQELVAQDEAGLCGQLEIPIRLKQVAQLLREGGGHGRPRPALRRL